MKCYECKGELDFKTSFRCADCGKIFCEKHEGFKGAGVCMICNALRQ